MSDSSPDPPGSRPLTSLLPRGLQGPGTPSRSRHRSPRHLLRSPHIRMRPPAVVSRHEKEGPATPALWYWARVAALCLIGAQELPPKPIIPQRGPTLPRQAPPDRHTGHPRGYGHQRWPLRKLHPLGLLSSDCVGAHTHSNTKNNGHACLGPRLSALLTFTDRRRPTHRLSFSRISGFLISFLRSSKVWADDRLQ